MISDTYTELIFLDLLKKRYLDLGIAPDLDNLKALENQAALQNAGENGSRVSYNPEFESEGSATKITETLKTFMLEIKAIQNSSDNIKEKGRRIFDRVNNNIALIGKDAQNITLELCTFELARQNGMHLSNFDNFATLSKINQQLTTAELNTAASTISLKRQPFATKYDLTHFKKDAFEVIVVEGPYLGLNQADGSSFLHMTDNSESYWVHQLTSKSQGVRTLALQIDMGKAVSVSKVSLMPLEGNSEDGIGIRVLVSPDGVEWQEMAPKRFYKTEEVDIILTPSFGRYIRLEFTKKRPSFEINRGEAIQVYEFGLDSLEIWDLKYYPRADFVSKSIELKDKITRVAQPINRLRIDVLDEKPPDTNITYYISTGANKDLLKRIEPGKEIILNTILDIKSNQAGIKSRLDNNHAYVDITIKDDFIPESLQFFRNTFQPNVIIDGVHAGWKLKDSYYSCLFEVEEETEINLGINFAIINNVKKNGINILKPGIYEFKTHSVNWHSAQSEDNDPLFPYNHKLIIEGLPGSDVYPGMPFQAAEKLKMISAFDLIKNIDNADQRFFAIKERNPLIKVARPPVLTDSVEGWRFEQYALRYKYKSADVTQVTSIIFVAKLSSNDEQFTPLLKGWTIIAGY